MTEKPALTQLLKINAGLTEQTATVYKYILIVGSLTIGEITEYTGFSYETTSRALDELTDKKLVRKLAHVVNRYVPVAPYRAFAELLVEFQREMKELEENARESIDSALTEISKTNEKWKSDAIRLRDEQVNQAKQEIRLLREEASNARKTLVEKLKRETEARKSSLTDMLKKHVDEHTARISESEKEINLKVDSSVAKFAETTAKLKEQVAQTSASYLSKFDERMRLFLSMVNEILVVLGSDFSSSVEEFEVQASGFLEDSKAKIHDLVEVAKTRTNDLIREVEKSFAQLSTELQRTASDNVDSSTGAISATNKDLELDLIDTTKTHGEKLTEAFSSFESKTRETLDRWKSAAKDEMQNRLNLLIDSIEGHTDTLAQKMESTKTPIYELLKSHLASAEAASVDLGSNMGTLTEAFKREMSSKTGASSKGIQESCDVAAKECSLLVTALEALSKRNVPLTSKTIVDFTSEVNGSLSKMTASLVTNAKSFTADVKEKMLGTLSDVLEAYQSKGAPTEPSRKGNEAQVKGSAVKKDISKKIDEVTGAYIDELEESISALDKRTSERISSILGFEKELAKKWDAITVTLEEVSELANGIKAFPQTIGKIVNELIDQYCKKADGTIAATKRLLNVHSTTLGDAISGIMKKWSSTVEKSKKEIADISTKRRDELGGLVSKQIETIEKMTADLEKLLIELISQKVETIKSSSLASQNTIVKQVGFNTEKIKESLKDIEEKLKSGLQRSHEEFRVAMDQKSSENNELSTNMINKTDESIEGLKQQLVSMISAEKGQVKQICENTNTKLWDTVSEQSKELREIASSMARSFGEFIDAASEDYRKEGESIKGHITSILSQHLKGYTESVGRAIVEINTTFTKHFEDCDGFNEKFGTKLDELLTTHQEQYEGASTKLVEGLGNCIDQDEAAVNDRSRRMLKEFTDNTTKTAKEAGSVEGLMRTAWAEIVDTQQMNADKTWHYVTKQAILNHIKDMVKRTKSTVTIVVPNIEEAPVKEIKEISKAIRINVIAGIDETFHKKLLRELFSQGNVRLWSLTEKDYISCTRDAEEVLIAPVARKDTDCVATASTEENYVKLYHKFIGPMWMASSREIKERTLV